MDVLKSICELLSTKNLSKRNKRICLELIESVNFEEDLTVQQRCPLCEEFNSTDNSFQSDIDDRNQIRNKDLQKETVRVDKGRNYRVIDTTDLKRDPIGVNKVYSDRIKNTSDLERIRSRVGKKCNDRISNIKELERNSNKVYTDNNDLIFKLANPERDTIQIYNENRNLKSQIQNLDFEKHPIEGEINMGLINQIENIDQNNSSSVALDSFNTVNEMTDTHTSSVEVKNSCYKVSPVVHLDFPQNQKSLKNFDQKISDMETSHKTLANENIKERKLIGLLNDSKNILCNLKSDKVAKSSLLFDPKEIQRYLRKKDDGKFQRLSMSLDLSVQRNNFRAESCYLELLLRFNTKNPSSRICCCKNAKKQSLSDMASANIDRGVGSDINAYALSRSRYINTFMSQILVPFKKESSDLQILMKIVDLLIKKVNQSNAIVNNKIFEGMKHFFMKKYQKSVLNLHKEISSDNTPCQTSTLNVAHHNNFDTDSNTQNISFCDNLTNDSNSWNAPLCSLSYDDSNTQSVTSSNNSKSQNAFFCKFSNSQNLSPRKSSNTQFVSQEVTSCKNSNIRSISNNITFTQGINCNLKCELIFRFVKRMENFNNRLYFLGFQLEEPSCYFNNILCHLCSILERSLICNKRFDSLRFILERPLSVIYSMKKGLSNYNRDNLIREMNVYTLSKMKKQPCFDPHIYNILSIYESNNLSKLKRISEVPSLNLLNQKYFENLTECTNRKSFNYNVGLENIPFNIYLNENPIQKYNNKYQSNPTKRVENLLVETGLTDFSKPQSTNHYQRILKRNIQGHYKELIIKISDLIIKISPSLPFKILLFIKENIAEFISFKKNRYEFYVHLFLEIFIKNIHLANLEPILIDVPQILIDQCENSYKETKARVLIDYLAIKNGYLSKSLISNKKIIKEKMIQNQDINNTKIIDAGDSKNLSDILSVTPKIEDKTEYLAWFYKNILQMNHLAIMKSAFFQVMNYIREGNFCYLQHLENVNLEILSKQEKSNLIKFLLSILSQKNSTNLKKNSEIDDSPEGSLKKNYHKKTKSSRSDFKRIQKSNEKHFNQKTGNLKFEQAKNPQLNEIKSPRSKRTESQVDSQTLKSKNITNKTGNQATLPPKLSNYHKESIIKILIHTKYEKCHLVFQYLKNESNTNIEIIKRTLPIYICKNIHNLKLIKEILTMIFWILKFTTFDFIDIFKNLIFEEKTKTDNSNTTGGNTAEIKSQSKLRTDLQNNDVLTIKKILIEKRIYNLKEEFIAHLSRYFYLFDPKKYIRNINIPLDALLSFKIDKFKIKLLKHYVKQNYFKANGYYSIHSMIKKKDDSNNRKFTSNLEKSDLEVILNFVIDNLSLENISVLSDLLSILIYVLRVESQKMYSELLFSDKQDNLNKRTTKFISNQNQIQNTCKPKRSKFKTVSNQHLTSQKNPNFTESLENAELNSNKGICVPLKFENIRETVVEHYFNDHYFEKGNIDDFDTIYPNLRIILLIKCYQIISIENLILKIGIIFQILNEAPKITGLYSKMILGSIGSLSDEYISSNLDYSNGYTQNILQNQESTTTQSTNRFKRDNNMTIQQSLHITNNLNNCYLKRFSIGSQNCENLWIKNLSIFDIIISFYDNNPYQNCLNNDFALRATNNYDALINSIDLNNHTHFVSKVSNFEKPSLLLLVSMLNLIQKSSERCFIRTTHLLLRLTIENNFKTYRSIRDSNIEHSKKNFDELLRFPLFDRYFYGQRGLIFQCYQTDSIHFDRIVKILKYFVNKNSASITTKKHKNLCLDELFRNIGIFIDLLETDTHQSELNLSQINEEFNWKNIQKEAVLLFAATLNHIINDCFLGLDFSSLASESSKLNILESTQESKTQDLQKYAKENYINDIIAHIQRNSISSVAPSYLNSYFSFQYFDEKINLFNAKEELTMTEISKYILRKLKNNTPIPIDLEEIPQFISNDFSQTTKTSIYKLINCATKNFLLLPESSVDYMLLHCCNSKSTGSLQEIVDCYPLVCSKVTVIDKIVEKLKSDINSRKYELLKNKIEQANHQHYSENFYSNYLNEYYSKELDYDGLLPMMLIYRIYTGLGTRKKRKYLKNVVNVLNQSKCNYKKWFIAQNLSLIHEKDRNIDNIVNDIYNTYGSSEACSQVLYESRFLNSASQDLIKLSNVLWSVLFSPKRSKGEIVTNFIKEETTFHESLSKHNSMKDQYISSIIFECLKNAVSKNKKLQINLHILDTGMPLKYLLDISKSYKKYSE